MTEVAQSAPEGQAQEASQPAADPKILQALYGDFERTKGELNQTRAEARSAHEKLARLGEALNPRQPQVENPDALHDEILEQALELEKKGQGIPLTLKISEALRTERARNAQMAEKLARLERSAERLQDPVVVQENQVFQNIDNLLAKEVQSIYGGHNKQVFDSAAASLVEEIRDLKTNDPEMWERIKLDPTNQKKLVNHFVKQQVPPKARTLMQEKAVEAMPFTMQDTLQAMREADSIPDQKTRSEAKQIVRQKYWEQKAGRTGNLDRAYR